jgi:hypothetical protein
MLLSRPQARAGARALGWLSIALGAAQLMAPRQVARLTGVPDRVLAMRSAGLREIATGVALLRSESPTTWLWARVAGDVLDAALLSRTLRGDGSVATRAALLAVGALAITDLALARRLSQSAPVAAVDYRARSGFPLPAHEMRGGARSDFVAPSDMRVPPALRPWKRDVSAAPRTPTSDSSG